MHSIKETLSALESQNRLRSIPLGRPPHLLDLSSNDYLSLAERSGEFRDEFLSRFGELQFSSSASRLLSGRQRLHHELEDMLSHLYGKDALLFNSGYHANVGCIGALALPSTLFVCDKLIHASVIDGLRIAGCEFRRFPHNDMSGLRKILERESRGFERTIVVVEAIYSMDGDEAPLEEIAGMKKEFPGMMLYVDEAHSFGVRGERGLGICEETGIIGDADIIIGTFGKAAASAGAFAISSPEVKSLFVNRARPFIFSTALPPVNVAWTIMMVGKIIGMNAERKHLATTSRWFGNEIARLTGGGRISSSQIVPLLTGDAARAVSLAGKLRANGVIALPIRRPTVPPGGERIRFSLGAAMTQERLQPVFDILKNEI